MDHRVMIGVDPHKQSVTIEARDGREILRAAGTFGTDTAGYRQLLAFARQWPQRTWAVEGANGIGRPPAQRLLADGEQVLDVPAELAARARVFDTGQGHKTDAADAHAIVMVALRDKGLRELGADPQLAVLRLLCDRRDELSRARAQALNRMHRLFLELIPGGAPVKKSARQYQALLATVRPRDLAFLRRRMAAEELEDLHRLDAKLKAMKAELKTAVQAMGSHLMDIHGVGPAGAARILADVGDVARFPDRNHFALVFSEVIPVGLLGDISGHLRVPVGTGGLMVVVPAGAAAVAAPVLALCSARLERRRVLVGLSALVLVSDVIAGLAPGFGVMLAARAVLGIGVGGFWVFGAGAAISLVSEQARGTAMAVVSSGIFIATVASLPVASLIGTLTTWRAAFAVAAVFAVIAVAAQLAAVPRLGPGGRVGPRSLLMVVTLPVSRVGLVAAGAIFFANFAAYTYIGPLLHTRAGLGASAITLVLLGFGLAGAAGNFTAGVPRRCPLSTNLGANDGMRRRSWRRAGRGRPALLLISLGPAVGLPVLVPAAVSQGADVGRGVEGCGAVPGDGPQHRPGYLPGGVSEVGLVLIRELAADVHLDNGPVRCAGRVRNRDMRCGSGQAAGRCERGLLEGGAQELQRVLARIAADLDLDQCHWDSFRCVRVLVRGLRRGE
jgi:transposase/MFS family permease